MIAPATEIPAPTPLQVYRWQDDAGEWHVSNLPPGDADNVEIRDYSPR